MYERMLNKLEAPAFGDMIRYCGDSGELWLSLDHYLESEWKASRQIRFPYGSRYGWGAKYSVKSKHICDVFAENNAFMALFKMSTATMESVYDELDAYAKNIWENRYPCGGGGWLNFRILHDGQLQDLQKILHAKMTVHSK